MTNKNIYLLGCLAVISIGTACYLKSGSKSGSPKLNGRSIFPDLQVGEIASVTFGDKLKVVSGADGWVVESYHNYPVDRAKLSEELLKLTELKVGQVARGKKIEKPTDLVMRDAAGKELAKLSLGEKHAKWGHGRYALFEGAAVLVSDRLDAFDGDGKSLVETKIVDTPYISFNDVVENVPEAELGFATGVVAKVTIAGDTNRTVTVGNVVKGGSDRYLKLDQGKWIYKVPSYSVDSLLPKPPPAEEKKDEAKPEPKKDEVKPEPKKDAAKAEAKK